MDDEKTMTNGVAEEDQAVDDFYDTEERDNEVKLKQRIETLEKEKISLAEEVQKLTAEIVSIKSSEEELKIRIEETETEAEDYEENGRALEAIAKRNVELETEVFKLQQDLISAMNAGEEANVEIVELKKVLGETEVRKEEVKKEKSETEKKVRELERKIGVLEVRETEEKSKKLRFKEEVKECRRRIEELGSELAKKEGVEEKLRKAEAKLVGVEMKARGVINGIEVDRREMDGKGPLVSWPLVVAGSAGVVVAAGVLVFVLRLRRA